MSLDIETFLEVGDTFEKAGFSVYVVTMRFTNEPVPTSISERFPVIYTGRFGKKQFMSQVMGIDVNVWVDDNPHFILMDAYQEASHDPTSDNEFYDKKYEKLRTSLVDNIL